MPTTIKYNNTLDVERMLVRIGYAANIAHDAALSAGVYDALGSANGDLFVETTAQRIAGKLEMANAV